MCIVHMKHFGFILDDSKKRIAMRLEIIWHSDESAIKQQNNIHTIKTKIIIDYLNLFLFAVNK